MATKKLSILKLSFTISIVLFCFTGTIWASNPGQPGGENALLFQQANQSYEKGDYSKAVTLYTQIIATGYENGTVYFNLGNAYLKQDQKGLAILNYEKARRLIPLDKELKTNLNLALRGVDEGEINWGREFYSLMTHGCPLNWLTASSSISFYLLILLIILWVLFPAKVKKDSGKPALWYQISLCFISCILFGFLFLTTVTFIDQHQTLAVSIKENVPVLNEPKPEGTTYFNLKEGSRVVVGSTQGDWCLIRRQDGKRGWVEQKNLGFL
jgi:tetratricopeptide (TPR) repeat protein